MRRILPRVVGRPTRSREHAGLGQVLIDGMVGRHARLRMIRVPNKVPLASSQRSSRGTSDGPVVNRPICSRSTDQHTLLPYVDGICYEQRKQNGVWDCVPRWGYVDQARTLSMHSKQLKVDKMKKPNCTTIFAIGGLLVATVSFAQENRSSMTLNESGQVLRFLAQFDDEPTAVIESGGGQNTVLAVADSIGLDQVVAMGAIADLNDAGVAVIQVDLGIIDLGDPNDGDDETFTGDRDGNQVLITSSGGAPTVIAVSRNSGMGEAFGDDTLCHIGPMPEINNGGQVAFFGHLDINGSGLSGRACEEAEQRDNFSDPNFGGGSEEAWSPSFIADQGNTFNFEIDIDTGTVTRPAGAYGGVDGVKSAIIRYAPGSGNQALLTGQAFGTEADMVSVSDPRWVSAPTDFYVSEVDLIRNTDAKFSANGVIAGFATLSSDDPFVFPPAVNEAVCDTIVVQQMNDNPNDNPDGSDPYIRYTANCPEVNVGVIGPEEGLLREAIILLGQGSPTVVAVAGPPGESDFQAFDYEDGDGSQGQFVINNAGQLLFKATKGQVEDPEARGDPADCGHWQESCFVTEYSLELYTPGVGVVEVVKTGDPVLTPGSDAAFCDFAPHYGLADDGSFAFLATIAGDGTCEFQSGTGGVIDTSGGARGIDDDAHDALFYYSGGVITELVRTQQAANADTGAGPFTSSWSGNDSTLR